MIELYNKKNTCCGCTACMNICPKNAITMEADEEGFLYPSINDNKCIKCSLCKKVCSFQREDSRDQTIKHVYAVKHKDQSVRNNSTSGGIFTAISDLILENKGIVFGVGFDEKMIVCHQKANTKELRNKLRGSKYVQSDLRNSFKEIEELLIHDNKHILFTGTPCQVDGLKSYLDNRKIKSDKLILCDIICHGVPSPLIFKEYIEYCEKKRKCKIVKYSCRDKVNGWHSHTERLIYEDGKDDYSSYLSQSYKRLFYSHMMLRESCHSCKYTNLNRCSDITIADFWGIEKSMPEFDDNKGISLVLVNNDKANKIIEEIKDMIEIRESDIESCLQPQLKYPSKPSEIRNMFWQDYKNKGFKYIIKRYTEHGMVNRIKGKILIFTKKSDPEGDKK